MGPFRQGFAAELSWNSRLFAAITAFRQRLTITISSSYHEAAFIERKAAGGPILAGTSAGSGDLHQVYRLGSHFQCVCDPCKALCCHISMINQQRAPVTGFKAAPAAPGGPV